MHGGAGAMSRNDLWLAASIILLFVVVGLILMIYA
jgi:hypothetical protein